MVLKIHFTLLKCALYFVFLFFVGDVFSQRGAQGPYFDDYELNDSSYGGGSSFSLLNMILGIGFAVACWFGMIFVGSRLPEIFGYIKKYSSDAFFLVGVIIVVYGSLEFILSITDDDTKKSSKSVKGDWVNGEKTGEGKYKWSNGDVYEGDWVNGARTGKGKATQPSGNVYIGMWKDSEREGRGILFSNGSVTKGIWFSDKFYKSADVKLEEFSD